MNKIFETNRLYFRDFLDSDFHNLCRLHRDSEVMKYISNGVLESKEAIKDNLDRIIKANCRWKSEGFGLWATCKKENDEFIGWFALKPLYNSTEIEVGYRLLKPEWGKGYATEGARFLVNYGIKTLKLEKIVGITHVNNEASKNVLLKSGLQKSGQMEYVSPRGEKEWVDYFFVKSCR